MNPIIVGNDAAIADRICAALHRFGVDRSQAQVLSPDVAFAALQSAKTQSVQLVFVASRNFAAEDLAWLQRLCSLANERVRFVAVGPVCDPRVVIRVIRYGVLDYLDVNDNFDSELTMLIERLKRVRRDVTQSGKMFAVFSPSGGAGVSAVASNLAVAIANKRASCALLDLHVHGGDQVTLFNAAPRHTLSALASKAENFDLAMFEQALVKHPTGVSLLAGPEPFGDDRQITPQVIQKAVQFARTSCLHTVADMEGAKLPDQIRVLATSAQIVMVFRADYVSITRVIKCLEYFKASNISSDQLLLVANRVGQTNELPIAKIEETLGRAIRHRLPDDSAAVNMSFNLGEPLVKSAPKSCFAAAICNLADDLLGERPEPTAIAPAHWLKPFRTAAGRMGNIFDQIARPALQLNRDKA